MEDVFPPSTEKVTKQSELAAACIKLAHNTAVAKTRCANVFFWSPTRLLGCFNDRRMGKITVETLLNWIECSMSVPSQQFDGYRLVMQGIDLEPNSPTARGTAIRCLPVLPPCGAELARNEVVKPGDYIILLKGSGKGWDEAKILDIEYRLELAECFWTLKHETSFTEKHEGDVRYEIPLEVRGPATQFPHYQGRCVVTGHQSDGALKVDLHWIYPPQWVYWHPTMKHSESLTWDEKGFSVPHNVIMMDDDVYRQFHDNAFGIDMYVRGFPNGKIYTFDDSPSLEKIPESPVVAIDDEETREFFRLHFQQCLFVGIFGGDVEDDGASGKDAVDYMLNQVRLDEQEKYVFPKGKGWEDNLGKAVKAWVSLYGVV
ncbi:hypothetical protein BD309DRAFT_746160 [Dichomitus squalens]|nr:hypothetical protein BD309DRAFT_746160 [Dichomitus squalens]